MYCEGGAVITMMILNLAGLQKKYTGCLELGLEIILVFVSKYRELFVSVRLLSEIYELLLLCRRIREMYVDVN